MIHSAASAVWRRRLDAERRRREAHARLEAGARALQIARERHAAAVERLLNARARIIDG